MSKRLIINHYETFEKSYKIEYHKERLRTSRMQETLRTDTYKEIKYYNTNLLYFFLIYKYQSKHPKF